MVRRGIMDRKPPTKYAPHAAHDEWRAVRRDVPPPMTSQALTISARHTSSTVPTRLRQRHSPRKNEWRAIARACVTEVRRPFHSHHSTHLSDAPAVGGIPTLYPSTPGRAHHGAQRWDSGYPCEPRHAGGPLDPLRPSRTRDLRRALARRLRSLHYNPQLPCDSAGRPSPLATAEQRRAPCAPNERMNKDLRVSARASCAGKKLRTWARASRALGRTCETWAYARAPGEILATTGATPLRPERKL